MKKFLIVIAVALLSLSFVACSGTTQFLKLSLWRGYEYEQLTYEITEEGVADKGTLVMTMEKVQSESTIKVPQINKDTKVLEEVDVTLQRDYFYLTRSLQFPVDKANGIYDTMLNITVTDGSFNPLYSFASLTMAEEQVAYTGEGKAPDCVSYVTSTKYTYDAVTSKWSAVSSCLRQTEYGKLDKAEWFFRTMDFANLTGTSTDMNMLYYDIRFINNLTDTNDFKYQCTTPMVLESQTKGISCTGAVEQHAVDSRVPYIYNAYKNAFGDSFGGFSLDLTKVTIFPTGQAVTGSGITVFYSRQPILAREELVGLQSSELSEAMTNKGSHRVPVIIEENTRPSSTTQLYPDSRGTITYRLVDLTNVKP